MKRLSALVVLFFAMNGSAFCEDDSLTKAETPSLEELINRVRSDDRGIASQAAGQIDAMGLDGVRAVPDIIFASRSKHYWKTDRTFNISRACIKAGGPMDVLHSFAKHPDQNLRNWTYRTLAGIGPAAHEVLPTLINNLRSDQALKQTGAFQVISRMGPIAKESVPLMIECFARPTQATAAMTTVISIGPSAVPLLTEALSHEDPAIRSGSAFCLGRCGEGSAGIVGHLQPLLEDKILPVRIEAANSVRLLGSPNLALEVFRTSLQPMLEETTTTLRYLTEMEQLAAPVVPEVTQLIRHFSNQPDPSENQSYQTSKAIMLLAVIGPQAKSSLPILHEMLSHPNYNIHIDAAFAVYRISERADETVTFLTDILQTEADEPEDATALLTRKRKTTKTMNTLRAMGEDATGAIPVLVDRVFDRNSTFSHYSLRALTKIGPASIPALEASIKRLETFEPESKRPLIRKRIERTLATLREASESASSAPPAAK